MKVRCYWNLRLKCWSVQDAKTRKLVGHATWVLLRGVTFTVSEAGRQRVLSEGCKNVHAFACGEIEEAAMESGAFAFVGRGSSGYVKAAQRLGKFVSYNPRRDTSFVTLDGETRTPIATAEMALLTKTPGTVLNRKAALLAFDPCDMTAAESAAATF